MKRLPRVVVKRISALELTPGDRLHFARGHPSQRITHCVRHDTSRTVDLRLESGRRATFQYDAEVTVDAN